MCRMTIFVMFVLLTIFHMLTIIVMNLGPTFFEVFMSKIRRYITLPLIFFNVTIPGNVPQIVYRRIYKKM